MLGGFSASVSEQCTGVDAWLPLFYFNTDLNQFIKPWSVCKGDKKMKKNPAQNSQIVKWLELMRHSEARVWCMHITENTANKKKPSHDCWAASQAQSTPVTCVFLLKSELSVQWLTICWMFLVCASFLLIILMKDWSLCIRNYVLQTRVKMWLKKKSAP